MTDYTKSTNFASKDSLAAGNPLKIVKGTEIDTEFNNIATAVATKANAADATLTGNPTAPTPSVGDNDTSIATTAFVTTAVANAVAGGFGFKNLIINGAQIIDQRSSSASPVTVNSVTKTYATDRFCGTGIGSSGVFTLGQVTTAPSNFINSLKATVTTADSSLAATDLYRLMHLVEGLNCADLGWGTAAAKTVTLSFYVYSNLTGTFGGSVTNSAANRSYPFSYTISAANTWEQKTVTIPGDTSGTWLTTNGIGISINWGLGVGSTYNGTANAWAGAEYYSATGATNVMGTLSNTFYITGVQLEKGSTATSFDYRPYGTELALCQRYTVRLGGDTVAQDFGTGVFGSTTSFRGIATLPVLMRATPSGILVGAANTWSVNGASSFTPSAVILGNANPNSVAFDFTLTGATAGQAAYFRTTATTSYAIISAEL